MVANKYAFLQITRRRFLNEWEAFKKVISSRNIRRRITIPLTLSNLKLLRRITRTENKFKIAEGQWYRYAPSYVSTAYHLLEGFPFIQEGDKQDRKSGSAGMPRPISYAVFCLKKKRDRTRFRRCRGLCEE